MRGLLHHKDSPYIRAIGFLYLRLTCPPKKLWEWFQAYLDDPEDIVPRQKGRPTTMGKFVKSLLLDQKFFGILFPRIPVPAMREIEKCIDEFDEIKKESLHKENREQRDDGEDIDNEERKKRSRSPERERKRKRSRERHNTRHRSRSRERKRRRTRSRSKERAHGGSRRYIDRDEAKDDRRDGDWYKGRSRERRSNSRDKRDHRRRNLSPSVTAKFSSSKPQTKVNIEQLKDFYGSSGDSSARKKTAETSDTILIGFAKNKL